MEPHPHSSISSAWLKPRNTQTYTYIFPHLYKIFLAAIHDILWGKAVDHVAGMKDNQEKNHTEEEKSLGTGSFRSYFVQLQRKATLYI